MGCLKGIGLLKLVLELKFLDVFMGREGSIDSDIYPYFCIIVFLLFLGGLGVLLRVMEGIF